jgi:hypothetical protein
LTKDCRLTSIGGNNARSSQREVIAAAFTNCHWMWRKKNRSASQKRPWTSAVSLSTQNDSFDSISCSASTDSSESSKADFKYIREWAEEKAETVAVALTEELSKRLRKSRSRSTYPN